MRPKDGVECPKCHFVRFKFMKVCPACEDLILRSLDTSTKIAVQEEKE